MIRKWIVLIAVIFVFTLQGCGTGQSTGNVFNKNIEERIFW